MYEHLYFMRKIKCKRTPSRVIPTSEDFVTLDIYLPKMAI